LVSISGDTYQPPGSPRSDDGPASVLTLGRASQVGVMVALCTGVVGVAFEMFSIFAVIPRVADDLDGNFDRYVWPVTMFLVGQVFSIVVSGRLIDRFGAYKPLAVGLVLFAIGLALAGWSPTMILLLVARTVQGLGGGALNIAVMVVLAEIYPEQRRSWMMTIFSFCYLGPAFIGPFVAATITEAIGWRYVFLGIIPFTAIAAAAGAKPLHQLYKHRRRRDGSPAEVPMWAAIAGTVGLTCLQAATQDIKNFDLAMLPLAVAGLIAVCVALLKMMPTGFWRFRVGMPSLMWVRLTLAGAFMASFSMLTLLLTEDRGYSLEMASLAPAVGALGWALGTILQSRPWLPLRRDQIIQIGCIFEAVSIGVMAVFAVLKPAAGDTDYLLIVAVFALLGAGFGMGLASASTSLALMTLSSPEAIGRNTSSLQVADGLGGAFVAAIAGVLLTSLVSRVGMTNTFGWIYGVNAAFALVSALLAIRLGRVRNESSGWG